RIITNVNRPTISASAATSSQRTGDEANADHQTKITIVPIAIAAAGRRTSRRRTTKIITVLNVGVSERMPSTHQSLTPSSVPVKANSLPARTTIGGEASARGSRRAAKTIKRHTTPGD